MKIAQSLQRYFDARNRETEPTRIRAAIIAGIAVSAVLLAKLLLSDPWPMAAFLGGVVVCFFAFMFSRPSQGLSDLGRTEPLDDEVLGHLAIDVEVPAQSKAEIAAAISSGKEVTLAFLMDLDRRMLVEARAAEPGYRRMLEFAAASPDAKAVEHSS